MWRRPDAKGSWSCAKIFGKAIGRAFVVIARCDVRLRLLGRHSRAEQGAERRAQTLESMPLRQGVPTVTEFCTVALCSKGHGMDTRVKPEYDDVTLVSANLQGCHQKRPAQPTASHRAFSPAVETSLACAARCTHSGGGRAPREESRCSRPTAPASSDLKTSARVESSASGHGDPLAPDA